MFGTVLSYVTLRLLGVEASHPTAAAARAWMLEHGGATAVPSWGKFWLATLGVYEWCVASTHAPPPLRAQSLAMAFRFFCPWQARPEPDAA